MNDKPAWGTPPRGPSAPRSATGPADTRPADDRLDELYASVVDTGRRPPKPRGAAPRSGGPAPSGRGRAAFALVAVLVVGAVVGWLVLRPGATGSSASGASETDWVKQNDIWAADSTPGLVEDLIEVAGGSLFTGIYLHTTSASAVAPTTPGATTTDRFSWRDGQAERSGPEGLLDADELFDATTVDWTAIERLVAQASELSGIDGRPSAVYVDRAVDGGASAAANLTLHMSDDYGRSARITADQQGQIVWMNGDIEGSPAFEWESVGLYQTERLQQAVADVVASAGSTQFEEISVYGYRISASALAAPEGTTTVAAGWREGFASAKNTTDQADLAALFDIAAVDWALVVELVTRAGDLTGVPHPEPWVSVERPWAGRDRGDVEITVHVNDESDDSTSGSVVFDLAGQVVSMRGGAPGSASHEWEASH